jgi:hypothetical protein
MPNISALGGIETWVYEMIKKYKDLDIAVVSKQCDEQQAKRLRKYCRLYIHTNEKIKCKVALINYDQSIIPYINEDADIYQVIHADYTNSIYNHRPHPHPRVKAFIAITKFLEKNMADMLKPNDIIMSYNPLTIEDSKPLIFVSATRLHSHKGPQRIQAMIDEMDRVGINYIWYIITGDKNVVHGKNVIFIDNRLDVDKWLSQADYVVLLSDSEACSYTLNVALYRNIPIITTPLPYLEEIGYKDGVNGYTIEFDCSNLKEVVSKLNNVPKFNFKRLECGYDKILAKSESKYAEDLKKNIKVKCTKKYFDVEENEMKVPNLTDAYTNQNDHPNRCQWITNRVRAEHLVEKGLVRIIKD